MPMVLIRLCRLCFISLVLLTLLGIICMFNILDISKLNFIPWRIRSFPPKITVTSVPSLFNASLYNSDSSKSAIKLNWTTLSVWQEKNEDIGLVSAYYDSRIDAPDRPAVIIIGYYIKASPRANLTCCFKYSNGKKVCLTSRLAIPVKVNCGIRSDHPSTHFICPVLPGEDIPVAVQLNCKSCSFHSQSGVLAVGNRDSEVIKSAAKRKKIGVCVQGPLRQSRKTMEHSSRLIQMFIRMSQSLGAAFVTMYASPEQIDADIIQLLLTNYSKVVNVIEWKNFSRSDAVYYYGQFELIHDCLYRHMYEVDYLAFIDLDEMIIPFQHANWPEMLDRLQMRNKRNQIGYSFLNRFYKLSSHNYSSLKKCADVNLTVPYFTWTDEIQCLFKHGARSKMIVNPRRVVYISIHKACAGFGVTGKGLLYQVPMKVAVSAHYRVTAVVDKCENKEIESKGILLTDIATNYANMFCKNNTKS